MAELDDLRDDAERLKKENEWLRRLLTWSRMRLRRDCYKDRLDEYLAAGPRDPDPEKLVQS